MKIPVFLRKEIREIFRTAKIYVLPGIFLFFGFGSPLLTKLTPELIRLAGESTAGIRIVPTAEPNALFAWQQLLKNLGTGLFVIILLFMGSVLEEKVRGTAVLVLTKPVKRPEFIWAKFIAAVLLVSFSTLVATLACAYYTVILWPAAPELNRGLAAVSLFFVYELFITALTVLASTLAKNSMFAAGGAVAVHLLLSLLASFGGRFTTYNPAGLMTLAGKLLASPATARLADAGVGLTITLLTTVLLVQLAGWVFQREEL
ncbi:MAG: ABC transporter permease [Firmicutes bacterium]|nr:ABC transporter permease [Bacillota bacterium]